MSVDASPQERAAIADPARIRELMLANLFAVFNERDPTRRLDVIARNYTEDVSWSNPDGTFQGHEAMNDQAQKLLEPHAGLRVQRRWAGPRRRRPRPSQLQPWSAEAGSGCQRRRRGLGARWADRRVAHALDRSELTTGLPAAVGNVGWVRLVSCGVK